MSDDLKTAFNSFIIPSILDTMIGTGHREHEFTFLNNGVC